MKFRRYKSRYNVFQREECGGREKVDSPGQCWVRFQGDGEDAARNGHKRGVVYRIKVSVKGQLRGHVVTPVVGGAC